MAPAGCAWWTSPGAASRARAPRRPEPGLKVRTQTEEIREIRKIAIELLLANHERECPTCAKSAACQLQDVARKLGIDKVRFKPVHQPAPVDRSSLVAGARPEQVRAVRRLRAVLLGNPGHRRD